MKRIIFFLLISFSVEAQQYVAEAPLSAVEKDGFYEVLLPPHLSAFANSNLRNVRITDENSKEVPIITTLAESHSRYHFVEYKMDKEIRKGCCTILTFENEKRPIDNVLLRTRNTAVVKWATLLGSDDKKD